MTRGGVESIWGESNFIRDMFAFAGHTANYYGPLLLEGEYGTGKELLAKTIHRSSQKDRGYFLKIKATKLQKLIVADEELRAQILLFCAGRSPLSFGALHRMYKEQVLETTIAENSVRYRHGGQFLITLYIDEVSHLDLEVQRALYYMVTSSQWGPFQSQWYRWRIICSSTLNLQPLVASNTFSGQLFTEISRFSFHLLPLRDHSQDIPILALKFLEAATRKIGGSSEGISEVAMQFLLQHSWPGNISELKSVMNRASCQASFNGYLMKLESLEELVQHVHRMNLESVVC